MDNLYLFHIQVNGLSETFKSKLINNDEIIVFFDGRNIICEKQIQMALFRAFRSKKEGNTIAKQFNIEILLHLAGTHQIKIALDLYDVKEDTEQIIILQNGNSQLIENAIPGYPEFKPSRNTLRKMRIIDLSNPCKEIISRGARFVLDHE